MNVAIIEDNKVVNVIVCESIELAKEVTGAADAVDADAEGAYMNFTRVDGVWTPPVVEQPQE